MKLCMRLNKVNCTIFVILHDEAFLLVRNCFDCFSDIDDCAGVTCENGGECEDKVSTYQCNCAAGYSGTYCEISE